MGAVWVPTPPGRQQFRKPECRLHQAAPALSTQSAYTSALHGFNKSSCDKRWLLSLLNLSSKSPIMAGGVKNPADAIREAVPKLAGKTSTEGTPSRNLLQVLSTLTLVTVDTRGMLAV